MRLINTTRKFYQNSEIYISEYCEGCFGHNFSKTFYLTFESALISAITTIKGTSKINLKEINEVFSS